MMGIALVISAEEIGLTPRVKEMLDPTAVARVAGRGVAEAIRANYQKLETGRPNRHGWRRQHLWSQLRRSTQNPVPIADGLMSVMVNHVAAAQRYFGGIIRAIAARMLTIPAVEEAYGKRAGEFSDLEFGFGFDPELQKMRPALVQAKRTEVSFGRRRKDGTRKMKRGRELGGGVYYWLTRKVEQKADPTTLPSEAEMRAAAIEPTRRYIAREAK